MREPLLSGTRITNNIIISHLLSEHGGTSLVYLAQNGHYNVIIKEFFPSDSNNSNYLLHRSMNGMCIETNISDENTLAKIESERKRFIEQAKKAELAIKPPHDSKKTNDYAAIYFFECTDITEEVKKTPGFENTSSVYLLFSCRNGMTLDNYIEYISKDGHLSLKQSLYITKSILLTLEYLHEDRHMLHLDIKPDNLLFSTDIKEIERSLCFLLDLEGSWPIGEKVDISSVSNEFAAPEIIKMFKIRNSFHNNDLDLSKLNKQYSILSNNIGTYSDLYSVAACMYKMIMYNKLIDPHRWEDCIQVAVKPKKLLELLLNDVSNSLNEEYPYLIEKITYMLFKGLYCLENNSAAFSEKLSDFRYCSCSDFITDIDNCLEILNNEGFHPEILAMHSREHFSEDYYFRKSGFHRSSEDLISDDSLFIQEWLPDVTE